MRDVSTIFSHICSMLETEEHSHAQNDTFASILNGADYFY
jgi:hypothetical protein